MKRINNIALWVLTGILPVVVFLTLYPIHDPIKKTKDLKNTTEDITAGSWVVTNGLIKRGQTLESVLREEGLRREDWLGIINEFLSVFNPRHLRPGQRYTIWNDSSGVVQKFQYFPELELTIIVERDSSGNFAATRKAIELVKRTKALCGEIKTTLYDAILEVGQNADLIIAFSDIFQWDVDFFIDPRPGDEFRMIYDAYYLPNPETPDSVGAFVRYGRIWAAQYTLKKTPLIAIYFDNHPHDDGYYAPNGTSFQKTFLKSPLNYRRISSYFSGARRHPITKKVRAHYAVDYAAPKGTPVVASADGTIIEKGRNKGLGNFIKIRHKNPRFVTLYGHLSRFAKSIRKGVSVKQQQVIGYVGATGLATGPHLHYAFYENGRPINPLRIKNTSADPVLPENQASFEQSKTEMLWQLMAIDAMERHSLFGLSHFQGIRTRCSYLPVR